MIFYKTPVDIVSREEFLDLCFLALNVDCSFHLFREGVDWRSVSIHSAFVRGHWLSFFKSGHCGQSAVMDFPLGSFLSRWKMGPVMCPFLVEGAKASTAFGSCRGGSEDPLLVSVGCVLGGLFVEVGLGTSYWCQVVWIGRGGPFVRESDRV